MQGGHRLARNVRSILNEHPIFTDNPDFVYEYFLRKYDRAMESYTSVETIFLEFKFVLTIWIIVKRGNL